MKKANIREVSRAAGVSITTVSRVLNNSSIPTPDTCRKVLEAVNRVGYKPDPLFSAAFRRDRNGQRGQPVKTRTLGYLTTRQVQQVGSTSHDGYYHDALSSVFDAAEKNDYFVMFAITENRTHAIPSIVAEHRVDGLVIQCTLVPELRQMLPDRLPVVFVDHVFPEISADSVVMDNAHAAFEMLDYLWKLGHRDIALFTDSDDRHYNYADQEGYRRFYQVMGLPEPCPELSRMQDIHPDNNDEIYAAYVSRLMAMNPRPTAIVFSGNVYAKGMMPHLQRAGLSVPRDLSIATLNDMGGSSGGEHTDSTLTSYRVPMGAMGAAAADLLMRRIENPSRPINKVLLNGRMIERTSCGPVPQNNPA